MSRTNNKSSRYTNVITTISLAVFLLLWSIVDSRLKTVESRIRSLELQIAIISVHLGVDQVVDTRPFLRGPGAARADEFNVGDSTDTLSNQTELAGTP